MRLAQTISIFCCSCVVYGAVATASGCGGGRDSSSGVPPANADPSGGSRLSVESLSADDGSSQPIGWFDTSRKEECAFGVAEDGSTRCLPNADVGITARWSNDSLYIFADSSCTTPVFWSQQDNGPCMPARGQYFRYTDDTCAAGAATYQYGAAYTGALYWKADLDAACEAMPANNVVPISANSNVDFTGTEFFSATKVPASAFVKATKSH